MAAPPLVLSGPNIKYEPDTYIPMSSTLNAAYFQGLYRKYASELEAVIPLARTYCKKGRACLSDQLEVEMSYMRVREAQPHVLYEISPSYGYSTLWISQAMRRNGHGKIYSFDVHNSAPTYLPRSLVSNSSIYRFILGDVRKTLPRVLAEVGPPDYAYLDSRHTRDFGHFLQRVLLGAMRPGTFVSWHDVYNAGFYSDDKKGRDLKVHPATDPTEEGLTVLQWLAFSGRAARVFSLSPSARMPAHLWVCLARFAVLPPTLTVRKPLRGGADTLPKGGCETPGHDSPTLYFELRAERT